VVIGGGQPKTCKTFLALDVAVSVASNTPCLGAFPVRHPGPALVYLAEDALKDVRARIECTCRSRGLSLDGLDLKVIAEPVLRLDQERDRARLRVAVEQLAPRLLVLDPLVRLHRLDENNSQEVSGLLGYLRELQREHDMSILLVHHTSKKSHARHGQSLRGSSDIHAWTDVGLYLTWQGDRLRLTPELRTDKAPEPVELRLVTDVPTATHLEIRRDGDGSPSPSPPASLSQRILHELERYRPLPLRKATLRDELRVNNAKLGVALTELENLGLVVRSGEGWIVAPSAKTNGVPFHATPGSAQNGTRNDTPGETDSSSAGVHLGKG
jgi:AAA domain-containing protein